MADTETPPSGSTEPTITIDPPETTSPQTATVTPITQDEKPSIQNVKVNKSLHDEDDFEVSQVSSKYHNQSFTDDDDSFSTPTKNHRFGDSFDDFTSKSVHSVVLDYKATEAKLLNHPLIQKNRPDPMINPKIKSRRSREIMREGYDLGFSSQGLRTLYDVNMFL